MEGANRDSMYALVASWALDINGDIRERKPIGQFKISVLSFFDVDESRTRSSFAVEETNIGCDIETTTQSLDRIAKRRGQSFGAGYAKVSSFTILHRLRKAATMMVYRSSC